MSIKDFLKIHPEIKVSESTLRNLITGELENLKQNDIIFAYRTKKQLNIKIVDDVALCVWIKR